MQKEITISMSQVAEATPIAHLVQLANQFSSTIYFEMESKRVNAKSIMGMMSLVLTPGKQVVVDADGEDESQAVEKIAEFLTH